MNRFASNGWGLLVAALCMAAFPVFAEDAINRAQRVDEIISQQKEIRLDAQNEKGGWDAISVEKRGELIQRQDRLFALLQGKQTIGDLASSDQVAVANDLEWIKALATSAEDERRICTRERSVGSMRATVSCRTVGQIRREREQSKDAMTQATRLQNIAPRAPAGTL